MVPMQSHYRRTEPQLLHDLRSLADHPLDHLHYGHWFLMDEILSRVFEGLEIGRRPIIHGRSSPRPAPPRRSDWPRRSDHLLRFTKVSLHNSAAVLASEE